MPRTRVHQPLTALAVLVCACGSPDQPHPSTDVLTVPTSPIDAPTLLDHVRILSADSMEGRVAGSDGNARARRYLERQFAIVGLTPFTGSYQQTFPLPDNGGQGVNLVGYVSGTSDSDDVIVLTAHYDHLGMRGDDAFNGADDNASGTAALLALAAHFSEHRPRHSMLFAAVDAEEQGLLGARSFLANPPVSREQIALNVNLDMVSHSDSLLFAAGTHHYPFLASYLDAVTPATGVALRKGHDIPGTGGDDWTGSSDHAPFHGAGIPFLYFGVEDHPDYHQPTDTFETINPVFFAASIETVRRVLVRVDEGLAHIVAETP